MTVSRIPRRRCDTCGDDAVCYADTSLAYFDGWHCDRCTLARCAPDHLIHALDLLAGIARWEPEVAKDFLTLREKAGSRLAKDALLGADGLIGDVISQAEETAGSREENWVDNIRAQISERARTVEIPHTFPDDLKVAYEKGREVGPGRDKDRWLPYPEDIEWFEAYKPHKLRTFKASDERRWAVSYLRHGCSDYEKVCSKLQKEASALLKQDGREVDLDEEFAIHEAIHRIVKNRVLAEIAARFPELADASEEQKV